MLQGCNVGGPGVRAARVTDDEAEFTFETVAGFASRKTPAAFFEWVDRVCV